MDVALAGSLSGESTQRKKKLRLIGSNGFCNENILEWAKTLNPYTKEGETRIEKGKGATCERCMTEDTCMHIMHDYDAHGH